MFELDRIEYDDFGFNLPKSVLQYVVGEVFTVVDPVEGTEIMIIHSDETKQPFEYRGVSQHKAARATHIILLRSDGTHKVLKDRFRNV